MFAAIRRLKGRLGLGQEAPASAEPMPEPARAVLEDGTRPSAEATGLLEALARKANDGRAADLLTPGAPNAQGQGNDQTRKILRQIKSQHRLQMQLEVQEKEQLERRAREIDARIRKERKFRFEVEEHSERVKRLAPRLGLAPERPITEVPPLTDPDHSEVEFITLREGRCFVRIVYDSRSNRYLYEVIEPKLSDTETRILDFIRDTLVRTLEAHRRRNVTDFGQYLTNAVEGAIIDHSIMVDEVSKQRILYYILRDFFGYGEIDAFMRDPMIEDISCDGPNIPVYLFHRQYESIKTNVVFASDHALDSYVIRLAQRSGKHISIADPLLDATLPDGSRLQASLSKEVTTRGSSFTIRKFRSDPLTPPDLVRIGTMSAQMAAYYWLAMEEGMSMLLAGGTASGKTTTLNAVSLFIPPDKKIVSIEDTREINLRHENWIAGLTRTGFGGEVVGGKIAGTIDMYKLLEAALRQRPEYLLVGEVRGPEAMTLFQAMATGHATYSTLHADSVSSAVYRLENPPIKVPRIMLQTLDAVGIQVQVRLQKKVARRIKELVEVTGFDPQTGDLLTNSVFRWDPATDTYTFLGKSHVFEQIRRINNLTTAQVEREWDNRSRVIQWMVDAGIRHIDEVARVISEYYRRPELVLQKAGVGDRVSHLTPVSTQRERAATTPPPPPRVAGPAEESPSAAAAAPMGSALGAPRIVVLDAAARDPAPILDRIPPPPPAADEAPAMQPPAAPNSADTTDLTPTTVHDGAPAEPRPPLDAQVPPSSPALAAQPLSDPGPAETAEQPADAIEPAALQPRPISPSSPPSFAAEPFIDLMGPEPARAETIVVQVPKSWDLAPDFQKAKVRLLPTGDERTLDEDVAADAAAEARP